MSSAPKTPRWQGIGLLALAFFAAARLSLVFAIPPGYATIVWPPAGIALAALWIWGEELWPGILLGSFAANAVASWTRGATGSAPILLAAWIGAGSSLQALISVALARRATGGRDPLVEERLLFRFMAVAGPLGCLVASAWGAAGMLLFKTIAPSEAVYSFATWWAGDAIGVAFAAPLIMLWAGRGPAGSRRDKIAVTAVFFAALGVVLTAHTHTVRGEQELVRVKAERSVADVSSILRAGLAGGVEVVRSAGDLFESRPATTRAEFARYAAAALARHPSLAALEWRPRVPDARRGEFERSAGLRLTEISGPGAIRPRSKASVYFPILYVEPLKGNEKALGLDVAVGNPVTTALERVLRTGEPAASGGVRLVQDAENETCVVILVPVRASGAAEPAGVMEGIYRVGPAVETLLARAGSNAKALRVVDVTDSDSPQVLAARGDAGPVPSGAVETTTEIAGRRWRVELAPAADFPVERSEQSWLILMRALVLMYLTSWVVLTLYGRAERIAAQVELKTAELREQERRLMRAQKMESVGRLAGGIAHEFNNILMGASGLAQLVLLSLGPKHASTPDLEGIVASIKRASNLVSQLLTYSRRREARMKPTDLNALVGGLSKMISAALGQRVTVQMDVSGSPLWIQADAGQVEQVLLNLCFNARDAVGGKGKIRVSTRAGAVGNELEGAFIPVAPGSYAVMEVADEGHGIPPDVLSHLAEPFFTTKPFGEGTGLGLSVVSGIVRLHRGGIVIRTAADEGTSMRVYWPAAAAPAEPTPAPATAAPRGSGLILVVDDEPMVRATVERLLAGYGYETVSASGGEEGLRFLKEAPGIRAVVLDLMMPGLDGLETYDRMSKLRPGIKVLILSGYAPHDSEIEVARRGLPFLAKPADPDELAFALHRLLSPGGGA